MSVTHYADGSLQARVIMTWETSHDGKLSHVPTVYSILSLPFLVLKKIAYAVARNAKSGRLLTLRRNAPVVLDSDCHITVRWKYVWLCSSEVLNVEVSD
jgi:hypothetical protein